MERPIPLFDERSRPGFRALYGHFAARAQALDAALSRIRLPGMNLAVRELAGLERIRVVLGEVNALVLSAEAESIAADPERRDRLELLRRRLEEGRLLVRLSPLGGWSPDFTLFRSRSPELEDPTLLLGLHAFERSYPHPGPRWGVLLQGEEARPALARFETLWAQGHDLRTPLERIFREALARARPRLPQDLAAEFPSDPRVFRAGRVFLP